MAADGLIRVWDVENDLGSPEILHTLGENMGWVHDLFFLPDGRLLSGSGIGVQIWDVEAGTFEWLLEREDKWRFVGVDDSGEIVASAGRDLDAQHTDAIRVWDRARDKFWDVTTHGTDLMALEVSPDGQHLISGSTDGGVRIGPITGEEPHLLHGHDGLVHDLAVSPDSQRVVSVSGDGDLRIWPMPEGTPTHLLPYDELLERLRAATNLRLIRDENEAAGYRIEALPFFGWPSTEAPVGTESTVSL